MFASTFCTRCNQRVRGPNHTCQPSAITKYKRIKSFAAKAQAAKAR
jgi:hypothetical protein